MSAQLVRMNTTASNLANAGVVAGSEAAAYKTMKPVFRTQLRRGVAACRPSMSSGSSPRARRRSSATIPSNPMADKDGNVFDAAVDETRELVDMMETARTYQNNVEVMQTAKSLIIDTLKLGR